MSNKMSEYYIPQKSNSKVIQYVQKGKLLIIWGFYDRKVQLIPINSKSDAIIFSPFKNSMPIVSVAIDKEEEFAFFGNSIGNISIMKIDTIPSNFYIDCNNSLNFWALVSINGYINIYSLPYLN